MLKSKADNLKNKTKNKALLKKRELEDKAAKLVRTITKNFKIILGIITIITQIILVIEISFFVVSILASFGSSPHFYCDSTTADSEVYKQYCTMGSPVGNNESIVQACNSIAVTDASLNGGEKIHWKTRGVSDMEPYKGKSNFRPETWISLAPQIDDLLRQRGTPYANGTIDRVYANCTYNAGSAIVWSGADDNYPVTQGPPAMREYLRNHKDKWQEVTGEDLMPGDICIDNGHIWISMSECTKDGTVKDNKVIQDVWAGSTAARYEGSWREFYPMMNLSPPTKSSNAGFAAFRFIGQIDENSAFKKLKP